MDTTHRRLCRIMARCLIALLCLLTTGSAATGPLPFFYDLYTFRGPRGSTTIVASFAVPAGELRREHIADAVRYRFDVSLVLADTGRRSVSRTDDSVFVRVSRPLAGEHLLFTHIEVQAPPSRSTVQRVIMTDAATPGVGQLYGSAFPIPDYRGSQLMLSDIALGQPGASAGWRRGDVILALLPTSQFPTSAFDVYYEIYNLPRGARYATEIVVAPVADSGQAKRATGDAVRLRFSEEAMPHADASLPELRRVESTLGRGRYCITVTVTNERTGERATRSRIFEVRGWSRGATLVHARPWRGR